MSRSLFILKKRNFQNPDGPGEYGGGDYSSTDYPTGPPITGPVNNQAATGMYNSAKFVVDELIDMGVEALVEIVIDNNDINRVVTQYRPTHVFIEGLWVVPEKFAVLKAIHPTVTWIVRIHSEIPFIATEGKAFEWITAYLLNDVTVAANAKRAHELLRFYARELNIPNAKADQLTPYLPNCYPLSFWPYNTIDDEPNVLDVGCFGAFRPLKNHLQQAFLAMKYAKDKGKQLRFHVNARQDSGGANPYKNVKAVIEGAGHELVLHDWEPREEFLVTLSKMDVLLQISISETFNIVAADATLVGIPILVSDEIAWSFPTHANPHDIDDALKKLKLIMFSKKFFITGNRAGLAVFAKSARRKWLGYVGR